MILPPQASLAAADLLFSTAVNSLNPRAASSKANTWEIADQLVGVSPQQIFAVDRYVYIVDKVENNTAQVAGHPAWAGFVNVDTNDFTPLDVISNSFCAGGSVLANGTWTNIGGNAAVGPLGVGLATNSSNPYGSVDGGKAARLFTPCDGGDECQWTDEVNDMPLSRWYPTVETLPEGDVIVIGGELYGSFVNTPEGLQNVPTYEFWPKRENLNGGEPINMTFLEETMPVNLYPLTWLLSDGRLFLQAGWQTTLLDYVNNIETRLPNISHAQRPYPAGAGSTMLPMTWKDNFTQTLVFAGGMNPERDDWNQNLWHPVDTQTSTSVVSITPLASSPTWTDLDDLPEGRSMGHLTVLPDGRLLLCNGANYGSEGYGWDTWAEPYGQSYATSPVLRPAYFNVSAPAGSQWDTSLPNSTIARMYHSVATLLYDGSVWVGGSNPNVDVITEQNNASYPYRTEYRTERFYPSYYDSPRPVPSSLPTSLTYGGSPWTFSLPSSSLLSSSSNTPVNLDTDISVVIHRGGFVTHVMAMGQRMISLEYSYNATQGDGSVEFTVQQMPPNPSLFAPGPAMIFIVVDGVPSNGSSVMVGSGQLGTQPTQSVVALPPSSGSLSSDSSANTNTQSGSSSGAGRTSVRSAAVVVMAAVTVLLAVVA